MADSPPVLDPRQNRIPEGVRRVHLIAVCGTAMGAVACALSELGLAVSGSDANVYPPMSEHLAARGIRLFEGYRAENLAGRPQLVVVGNAVSRDNPEVQATGRLGLPYCSMPQAVNHFMAAGKRALVVTGTHGKTTTAALLAWVLQAAGLQPGCLIGGIAKNFGGNYRLGAGEFFVVEGDEYDTAFFDKGPKFNHYRPAAAVLTSLEFDHADIYRDLAHVKQAFAGFVSAMEAGSTLVAYDGDAQVSEVVRGARAEVRRYGQAPGSHWRLGEVRFAAGLSRFAVLRQGAPFGRFELPLIGRHNVLNALAVIAVADRLGLDPRRIACGLESFAGVRRRQELRGEKNGVTVMDDFAHHPTAVRETLSAVRAAYPGRRLVAVFEPRTNSSMRSVFQKDYAAAFDAADLVCVRHPPLLKKVPAGQRFSSKRLAADLRRRGKSARYFENTEAIIDYLAAEARPGDVVVAMSNGGFDDIHRRLLEAL